MYITVQCTVKQWFKRTYFNFTIQLNSINDQIYPISVILVIGQ